MSQEKSVIHYCQLCKKYYGKKFNKTPTMMLPAIRTTLSRSKY